MATRFRMSSFGPRLAKVYPWTKSPLIIAAPMRVMAGPSLAVAVSLAGGIGFIGPGATPSSTHADLSAARDLLRRAPNPLPPAAPSSPPLLPLGIGFQLWNGDLATATRATADFRPAAVWLFAPAGGQPDIDAWAAALRAASPGTQVWVQVGTLREAEAAAAAADVLVVQGAEAGGHGRDATLALGLGVLLPEVLDAVRVPVVAAGGVADGRGVAAVLGLGADGVALGTRFLASTEARIVEGYRREVVRARDGASSTAKTMLYNELRGTVGWPEGYSPRGIVNRSWEDHRAGVPFEELKRLHDEAERKGDEGWGPEGRLATYAGANVGLIHSVKDAGEIVEELRRDAIDIIRSLAASFEGAVP